MGDYEEKKVAENNNNDNEFNNERVPLTARKGFWGLLMVSLGYVFVVTSMQVGGQIGVAMNMRDVIGSVLVSSVILAVLASFMAVIACKTGLNLGMLSKYSFGQAGTYVPVAIVTITTIGWFSIDAYLIGQSTNALFENIPIIPMAILGGVGMTLTALKGMKWMTWLSNIAVPLIIIFGTISMVLAVRDMGGWSGMMAMEKTNDISFSQAVSLGVGSYAVGAIMFTPDIMRFSKSAKTAVVAMFITLIVGNSFIVLSGAIGSVATGNPDIAYVLKLQGLLAPAFLVLILNIWSTAQGCVYSSSMSLGSVTKVSRQKLVIGFGVLGIILALLGFYNYFGNYINFLSSSVPPLAGIFLADFLFVYRGNYPEFSEANLPKINWEAFVSWIVGFAVSFIPVGMGVINGVVITFIVRILLHYVVPKKER